MGGEKGRARGVRAVVVDPVFGAVLLLGLAGLAFSPGQAPSLWALAGMALVEELVFRGLVQDVLEERWRWRMGPLTLGNLCATGVFAAAHLYSHSPLWALATVGPSLCYGLLWTRHRRVWPCAVAHFVHNVCFFYF